MFCVCARPRRFAFAQKVLLPADLKGMKVRPATSTVGQMVTLLGGTNVQASAPESRDAIERGVADAITFPWGSLTLFGIDKVVKFHMDVPLYVTPFVWVMNVDKYNSLSPLKSKRWTAIAPANGLKKSALLGQTSKSAAAKNCWLTKPTAISTPSHPSNSRRGSLLWRQFTNNGPMKSKSVATTRLP